MAATTYAPNPTAIARAAQAAGFSGDALVTAVAVAGAESDFGGDRGPSPTNDNGDWQVNTVAHPQYDATRLITDDLYNAQAAFAISGGGKNWTPWTTYTSGKYLQFMPQAQQAVAQLGSTALAAAAAFVFPLAPGYTVGQAYHDPKTGGTHPGVDLDDPLGTPIYAAAAGTIASVGGDPTGFGNDYPTERLADGTTLTYGHASKSYVTAGQTVTAGQIIALVGSEGDSTGPHLHFQVNLPNGQTTDPLAWLAAQNAAPTLTGASSGSVQATQAGLLSSLDPLAGIPAAITSFGKTLVFWLIKGVLVMGGAALVVIGVASTTGKSTSLPSFIPIPI